MQSFTYKLKLTGLALFVVVFGLVAEAAAQIPRPNVFQGGNRWRITGYLDESPVHQQVGSQDICFLPFAIVGTHIRGVWFSPTFPGWTGRYSQEGDRVLMYGNWGNFIGSDGIFIELTEGTSPRDVGGGQWTEWFNFGAHGSTVVFANTRLARVGRCRVAVEIDHQEVTIEITNPGPLRRSRVPAGGGYGLIGMRERVMLYGGSFHAGPIPDDGFRVSARLPFEPSGLPQ